MAYVGEVGYITSGFLGTALLAKHHPSGSQRAGLKLWSTLDWPLFAVILPELTLNGFQGVVGGPAADIGAFEVDEILPEVNTFYFC